jgi:hypothetical protein
MEAPRWGRRGNPTLLQVRYGPKLFAQLFLRVPYRFIATKITNNMPITGYSKLEFMAISWRGVFHNCAKGGSRFPNIARREELFV